MNLERAILLVLSASPRAIPATVILPRLGEFLGGEHSLGDVTRTLHKLERDGEAKSTSNKDFGLLWKETDDGRLRIG
jgi:DNA-binding PadR family transcriptional regulator